MNYFHITRKKLYRFGPLGETGKGGKSAFDFCFIQKEQHYFNLSLYWTLAVSLRRMKALDIGRFLSDIL
jgi:hypothetical protein